MVDNLTYTYGYNNQVLNVTDAVTATSTNSNDFRDGTNTNYDDYAYDNNGNLIIDLNKKIGISYNYLNLPQTIVDANTGQVMHFMYTATGTKLEKKICTLSGSPFAHRLDSLSGVARQLRQGSGNPFNGITSIPPLNVSPITNYAAISTTLQNIKSTGFQLDAFPADLANAIDQLIQNPNTTCNIKHDYIGNIEYQTDAAGIPRLEAAYTEEGRINLQTGTNNRHEYAIKDHLGNTRVCFTPPATGNTPTIIQQTNYYSYGLPIKNLCNTYAVPFASGGSSLLNKYQYNGIELNTDFGLLVNEARFRTLDPQLGRWWQIDPEVEQFEAWSPYNSNLDNPIRYNDPEGDCAICPQIGGFIVGAGVDLAFQTYSKYQEGGWDNVGDYNYRSIYISGTAGAVAVTGGEIVLGLGVPIGGTVLLIGVQSGGIGGLESIAKQILATQDDNGNYVSPVDAEVSLPKVAADATISAATGGYGTTAGHMAGEFAGKETGQVLGTVIDATMEGSENMLQIITDSKINANKTQTNTSKAPAPKKPQSLPARLPNQNQPTQGVW